MKLVMTFLVLVDIQGPNLEQKLPSTMESIVSTEPACSLDCGPAGNCYIEQSRGDEVDVVIEDDDDDDDDGAVDLEGNTVNLRRKQGTFRQRCQCPLGRGGDRCQLGKWYSFLYLSICFFIYSINDIYRKIFSPRLNNNFALVTLCIKKKNEKCIDIEFVIIFCFETHSLKVILSQRNRKKCYQMSRIALYESFIHCSFNQR